MSSWRWPVEASTVRAPNRAVTGPRHSPDSHPLERETTRPNSERFSRVDTCSRSAWRLRAHRRRPSLLLQKWYPRRDSNPRTRLRRPVLYPTELRGHGPIIVDVPPRRQRLPGQRATSPPEESAAPARPMATAGSAARDRRWTLRPRRASRGSRSGRTPRSGCADPPFPPG